MSKYKEHLEIINEINILLPQIEILFAPIASNNNCGMTFDQLKIATDTFDKIDLLEQRLFKIK